MSNPMIVVSAELRGTDVAEGKSSQFIFGDSR